jgi:hypothetical protein
MAHMRLMPKMAASFIMLKSVVSVFLTQRERRSDKKRASVPCGEDVVAGPGAGGARVGGRGERCPRGVPGQHDERPATICRKLSWRPSSSLFPPDKI